MPNYKEVAREARIKVLELIYKAQTSHIGSNFSAIDIMAVLFEKMDLDKDKFVLSAGWKASSLYYFMWKKGLITEDELNSFCQEGSKFIGLSEPVHPFIPFAGGSMGLGLPAAVGFALSKKLKGEDGKVYCLMSDGELQIGTTWESALIASHHKLDNLIVIVDNNRFQAMGKVRSILDLDSINSKFSDFGFENFEINGHDFKQIDAVLSEDYFKELNRIKNTDLPMKYPFNKIKDYRGVSDNWPNLPIAIIANTIKGKGVSWMEGDNKWHYLHLSEEEYNRAKDELCHSSKDIPNIEQKSV